MKDPMKDKDNNSELDALINACLEDELSEAEADKLSHWIEESSEARQRYWQLASVHGMIEQSMQSASLKATTGEEFVMPMKMEGLSRWPRIPAVAAGIAIGIFSVSVVWAFTIPLVNQPQSESREIVFESFEDPELKMRGSFPTSAGKWFGRILSVPGKDRLPAVRGTRVGKFHRGGEPKFTYARYLIDLDEYEEPGEERVRSVEVNASFFSSNSEEPSVFQIRLGAFSQEPGAVRPIWNDRETLFDTVLQHGGRNYTTKPGKQPGWHKLRATIEIPPGARSVVISLGAGNVDPDTATSDHYVDAVHVHFVDTFAPQK